MFKLHNLSFNHVSTAVKLNIFSMQVKLTPLMCIKLQRQGEP